MDNLRDRENSTSPPVITTSASSASIKRKDEASIIGLAKRVTSMRGNSRPESAMVEGPSGGVTAVGTRANSEMVCKVAGVCSIAREAIVSTRATGTTVCSTVRAHSTSRTGSGTRVLSRRTSSTETVFSTRTTPSSTVSGRITSCLSSTWSSPVWATSDTQQISPFN